jgi:dipeptidyl aminopeptidase/acylaminoacyl peptidase
MMFRVLVLLLVAASASADDAIFKNTDVFELEIAADPQVSPDGSQIAYSRVSMDIMTDRPISNIWIIDADGDNHRPLLSGAHSFSSPRWSPSGDRLAYITAAEGRGAQIHVRWMDTGQTAMLTNVRHRPSSLSWSPDGSQIALEMLVISESKSLATPPAAPEGAEWAEPAKIIETMPYRADGAGYLDAGFTHVFVLSADGGTPRQVTSGDYDHGGPLAWTSSGERMIFAANRKENWDDDPLESELWSVDIASGDLEQLTDRDGPDFSPTISPNGSTIAFLGFDDQRMGYHNVNVYLMDTDGGPVRNLTGGFDRSVADVQWAGNSRLYIQYDDHGRRHIATLSMNGDVESVANDVGGVNVSRPYTSGGFSVAANGTYAYSAGRPHRPADIGSGRGSRSPSRITDLNEDLFGHKTLGEVEELIWRSADDDYDVQGWLVKPPGFEAGKQYPLLLEIHGGPFTAYSPSFSAEVQLYAAAGYVVLYTNPRGSTSYGAQFANEIHHNYPNEDYDDLMAGVDAAIDKGFVDEGQLYVTGGSGGGVLTAWIVGKTDRFRAAVVAKPVINWTSFSLNSDITGFVTRYWFASMPWDDPDAYWARSPLSLVGNVTTPTALLTGERDFRTPISESEQYYQALKLRNVDTAMVRIPEASHGIAGRPSQLIAKVDNILAWFERYAD